VKNGRKIKRKKRRNKFRYKQTMPVTPREELPHMGFIGRMQVKQLLVYRRDSDMAYLCLYEDAYGVSWMQVRQLLVYRHGSDMAYLCLYEDAIIRTKSSTIFCTV
jgi:hypothetical protein